MPFRLAVSSESKFDNVKQLLESVAVTLDNIFFMAVKRKDILGSALCGMERKSFSVDRLLEVSS